MFQHKFLRNHRLLADYRRHLSSALAEGRYSNREQLVREVLLENRPPYDVSFDYALKVMYKMLRDKQECPARGLKRRMWLELQGHVEECLRRRNCSIADAVAKVLAEQRASRYFLSYKQASKIIYHERKNRFRSIRRNPA